MALRTGETFSPHMFIMQIICLTIIVVLVRAPITVVMTRATLRVDIERAGGPGRRGPPAVTTGIGAGAAVEAWRTKVFIVKAGRDTHLGAAVVMRRAVVASVTARGDRTVAQHVVLGVGPVPVRSGAA